MNPKTDVRTLLLVEDSENDIEMTLEALEEYKFANKIEVVRDGVEALDYLFRRNNHASRPDGEPVVVLLDVKLPKLNGIEVLQAIRSAPRFSRLPVVMVTSSKEEPDLRRCYELGCNAYVVKPVDFRQFTEALKTVGCFWALLNEAPLYP